MRESPRWGQIFKESICNSCVKISLIIRSETDLYWFEHPHKSAERIAMLDTVITITISVTLSLLAIRLGVEIWLDSAYDG